MITDLLKVLERGTSQYPLEELFHQLSETMGFRHSTDKLNRWSQGTRSAYETVYDMLQFVDANGKHTEEQHQRIRQLVDIIGAKILKNGPKFVDTKTVVLQEMEDEGTEETKLSVISEVNN
ncbi:hypothetical protein FBU59_006639 [Linderina macrospora]|uniref:Uncharacterized protein n=1 Tax=Linderina macrospora TaxID=4868 RepID=A0ACC1IZB4_9FUNG|nr:hypothetical protein FBU59_006639 [Linderina macrospora]